MSTWSHSLLLIATVAWGVQAAVINPVIEENTIHDGLLSVPFVGVDRKASNLPKWGFQKVNGESSSSVKVPLENIDLAYLMNLSIGTPPQQFTLLLDTGSSTTWVPVESCGILCGSPPHTLSTKTSSTFELMNMQFNIRYGEGFSQGYYAKDTFTFEGNISVANTAFAVSNFNDGELTANGADGIIGIGPDALSKYNNPDNVVVPTIVSSMQQAGVIRDNMFSVYFKALDDAERGNGRVNGNIIFGGGK
ncbi:aspartic peptidase domain-containing protein [Phascolomyces articulosus]|uniref:Aspartic peptidase domain-containing protein n=1 Tax=Phascolomyces articulosus TaxID=60185 RepID=A0AAD5KHW8_9FUNG|nr:aspartic peptidase domain-containing protein [Phascolomyces articulosus]